jgi:hypothetical protein
MKPEPERKKGGVERYVERVILPKNPDFNKPKTPKAKGGAAEQSIAGNAGGKGGVKQNAV